MSRRPHLWLLPLALLAASACANHPLTEGLYAFTATETLTDTCGLLSDPESLWDGHFVPSGQRVWIEYDLYGTRLVGEFQEVSDSFDVDGTSPDVITDVGDQSCRLDFVAIHIDGTAGGEGVFSGQLRVQYQSDRIECRCDLSVRYRAEKISD